MTGANGCRPALLAAAAILASALAVPAAYPEENSVDFILRDRPPGTSRLLGLGGAFVGLGDDVNALTVSPAALPTLPRTLDTAVTVGRDWSGFLGGAAQLHRQWSFGPIVWAQPPRQALEPAGVGAGFDVDSAKVSGPGAAVGWRPRTKSGRASFGVSYLRAGLSARDSPEAAGEDWANVWCFGAFFRPLDSDAPRLGLTYRPRTDWTLRTTPSRSFHVRKPTVVSAGASWSYRLINSTRILATIQQDLVRYSEITPTAGGVRPHDDFDSRLGVEVWIPWGCETGCGDLLQLRAAVISRAPVPFAPGVGSARDVGQGPARKTFLAGGVSIALRKIWLFKAFESRGRFLVDVGYDHETRALAAGLAFRYPQAFRGELRHQKRPN